MSMGLGLMDSLTRGSHIFKTVLVAVLMQWQLRELLEEQNRFARGDQQSGLQCVYGAADSVFRLAG